ncbi:MAG: glycosyltransferase family 4 protein [Anaerolineae bacterium]|nr:glycosyltransferase family 4 protein [Anaerolineae bacterium]
MRIALYHNLPSGGAKRTLYEMVRQLTNEHQIDVFTLSCANHTFADLRPYADNHYVYHFESWPSFNSPFGRLNQATRLADLSRLRRLSQTIAQDINRAGYDVLFLHPCQFEKCPSVGRFTHLPVVYYCQEPLRKLYEEAPYRPYDGGESSHRQALDKIDPLPKLYYSRLKQVDQENTQAATRVLVNSQFMQQAVEEIYQVEAQVSYHGVDVIAFHPLHLERQRFVLSVGSLTPMKGFDFLIKAIGEIPADSRPPLVIVSNFQNSDEQIYLEQLALDLAVELQLEGNVGDKRLVELYNQAAVVAYSPHREPFGLVPLEAMACATPVVAVSEGGVLETVVHEKSGLLVERVPALFAEAIGRLLDDPELAQAYGRYGRTLVEQKWTWDTAIAHIEGHLATAVAHAAPAYHPHPVN